jgi:hypothetical protein
LSPDGTRPWRLRSGKRPGIASCVSCVEASHPHTRLDEQLLYPEVSHRVGTPLLAASMNYDHRAIRRWIDRLESADVADVAKMQELLYGLDALIRVHVRRTSCI